LGLKRKPLGCQVWRSGEGQERIPQNVPPHPKESPYQTYYPPRKSILPLVESIALPFVSNLYWMLLEKVADSDAEELLKRTELTKRENFKTRDHILNSMTLRAWREG
jgi:hypothetical protein